MSAELELLTNLGLGGLGALAGLAVYLLFRLREQRRALGARLESLQKSIDLAHREVRDLRYELVDKPASAESRRRLENIRDLAPSE